MARLHARALPHGFFAELGEGFLRAYLRGFVDGPHAVALAVDHDGRLAGFVVGPTASERHWRWVLRHHAPRLALVGTLALLRRPRLLSRFVRTRLGRYLRAVLRRLPPVRSAARAGRRTPDGTGQGASHDGAVPAVAVLTHVAVDEVLRGRGSGRALVDGFVGACHRAGAGEVRLVTRAQDGAGGFYTLLGWERLGERTGGDGTLVEEFRVAPEESPSP